jgi:hypothetical protein
MAPQSIKELYIKLLNGRSKGFHPEFCNRHIQRLESAYPSLKSLKAWI